uniref:Putative methyltransferase n=1 Tax=viral metagenome TaxID=1070528 RepID=A0A6M3XMD7_9ZZZZ
MKITGNKPVLNKKGKPLTIGMIGDHWCIRVHKRALALQKCGYRIIICGRKVSYGTDQYPLFLMWHDERQFKNAVRVMINEGADILDFSNEPDHPVRWIREVIDEMGVGDHVKLVTDLHDLDLIRRGFITKNEREMFMKSDGLIYVSIPIQEKANYMHSVTKPNIVLYSYCNQGIIKDVVEEEKVIERKGLVYQGGANAKDNEDVNRIYPYRYLYDIIKKLVEMGNETHMYVGNVDAYDSHQETGAIMHPPTIYDKLMKELLNYKYGILIFNNEKGTEDQVNFTLTNKFFEYTAAGLPSLACWCPENMKLVEKWGVGFTFENISEIKDCSHLEEKYPEIINNIEKFNKEVYMENFIVRYENLLAELLGVPKKGVPAKIKKLHKFEYGREESNFQIY